MRRAAFLLTAVTLVGVIPAGAADQPREVLLSEKVLAKRLAKVGNWDFASTQSGPDGQPECRESWYFRRDGTGWVQSGAERVTHTWRVLTAQGAVPVRVVYVTSLSSNGEPDCVNQSSDPASYPRKERGYVMRFFDDNSALVCGSAEFQHSADRKKKAPLIGGRDDCWGRITPIARD